MRDSSVARSATVARSLLAAYYFAVTLAWAKGATVHMKLKSGGRGIAKLIAAIGLIALGAATQMSGGQAAAPMQSPAMTAAPAGQVATASLSLTGEVKTELHLSAADLKALPRTSVKAFDAHEKQTHVFEGVTLQELLNRAGVPTGEDLRGKGLAMCVVADAADGYRAVYSLGELEPSIGNEIVLVADTVDGQRIPAGQGPLRLVVPSDKRPARWVRMLQTLTVVSVSTPK
jgi:DMSO/TMAO reductase YedYZ molybdopterin-dependent catalytic subunit